MTEDVASLLVASLENVVLDASQLRDTPSATDGVPSGLEYDLRLWGCGFIQELGLCLRIPQTVMGTAQVLFQRFFYRKSMRQFSVEAMAVAAVFLASKVEENMRQPRDIINAFHYFKCKRLGVAFEPLDLFSSTDYDLQAELFRNEKHLLRELAFNVQVQHPHKLVINYLKVLQLLDTPMTQRAWNYMTDSFRTTLYLRFQPHTIACAAVMLAARDTKTAMPHSPPWWLLFDADRQEMEEAADEIMRIYSHKMDAAKLPVTAALLNAHLEARENANKPSQDAAAQQRSTSRWDRKDE